jgi:hypothetical protein
MITPVPRKLPDEDLALILGARGHTDLSWAVQVGVSFLTQVRIHSSAMCQFVGVRRGGGSMSTTSH